MFFNKTKMKLLKILLLFMSKTASYFNFKFLAIMKILLPGRLYIIFVSLFPLFKLLYRYSKNIVKYIILFIILFNILLIVIDIYSSFYTIEMCPHFIPSGDKNDAIPVDPVRWWPSGVPQGWTVIGTALASYVALSKIPGVSPRFRVLGSLGSAGVSASQITYQSAIENSVGFNRLMWGLSEYRKTGSWPSIDKINDDNKVNEFVGEALKHADTSAVDSMVKEVFEKSNKFLPSSNFDFSEILNKLIESMFKETMQLLQPVNVQGYFDDLIGQRMFIEVNLFILDICLILLFIVFIFNLIFLFNKDKIISKFDNKFITFYVKYQAFISRITLIVLPIFIFTGLFTLSHGLHWLITHQIPYESLDVDLHKFISSSHVFALTFCSRSIKQYNYFNKL